MNTIEIKRWDNGNVIFSYTDICNTNINTLKQALKQGINLSYADLSNYDLFNIDMSNINLTDAKLIGADLCYANLIGADLTGTDLSHAYINNNTKITHKQLINVKGINNQCPKEGSFIGWKKCFSLNEDGDDVGEEFIVKLEIPADAKRCSGTGEKCRCSHAKVLEIQYLDGTPINLDYVYSYFNIDFWYKVGEIVKSDSFDDRYWVECSHGIHFFMKRKDAVDYDLY